VAAAAVGDYNTATVNGDGSAAYAGGGGGDYNTAPVNGDGLTATALDNGTTDVAP
jgi:hypothetical protein